MAPEPNLLSTPSASPAGGGTSGAPTSADVVLRGRVVLPDSIVDDGVVVVAGDRIAYAGPAVSAPALLPPADPGALLLPGLVDLHNHGGGGVSLPDAVDADQVRQAVSTHREAGTTTMLASLVTAGRETLLERAALLGGLAAEGEIAGLHVEGPFLSHERRGAQSPDHLSAGDAGLVRELVAAAGGRLRVMTVAPEVPGVVGAGGAAEALVAAGVIPSLGHTSGTLEQAEALIAQVAPALAEQGLRMTATHLFNGMPPLHHREPGPVAACLAAAAREDLVAELVADGVHLAPGTTRSVMALLGDSVALVTDAMAATGMPEGLYRLGPMDVMVRSGVARLATEDGTLGAVAGGTARLIDVVGASVGGGVPLVQAVRAASWTPARTLGLHDVGGLVVGRRADVLVTDARLSPRQVWRAGVLVSG